MGFFDLIASIILMYMFFKVFQAILTPFVIVFLRVIYKVCGKTKEFNAMLATYNEKNKSNSSCRERNRINPGSGLLMMGNSNIDIGGNLYGTSKINKIK